jgi:hypothetical protein
MTGLGQAFNIPPHRFQDDAARDILGLYLCGHKSPQAKGRMERLWETLQSRLPVRRSLNGITCAEQANAARTAGFDLGTLRAAKYSRKTDNRGGCSFQNYIFQIDSPKSPAKKNILFLSSEKTGFKAYYDKTYHDVKFLEYLNKGKKSHLPQVAKRLIYDAFFAGVKGKDAAAEDRGLTMPVLPSMLMAFRNLCQK